MKKTTTKSCLHVYYGSEQAALCQVRVVLSKTGDRPALKAQKGKKGLHALGSN
jgi:hypothetical protein